MALMQDTGSVVRLAADPLFAPISTSLPVTVVVRGVPGKVIRVISLTLAATDSAVVHWISKEAGALSGPIRLVAGVPLVCSFNPAGFFQTAAGEDLMLTNSPDHVSIGGYLTYVLLQ